MRDFSEFKAEIKGKKVAVAGVGVSNTPLIQKLLECGAEITAFDKKTSDELGETYAELSSAGVKFELGEKAFTKIGSGDFVYVFRTPGIRNDAPFLTEARQAGSTVTSEMELFFEFCKAKTIGVTGSDGKTTTTTLIYEILKKNGIPCRLGGNIGQPLIAEIEEISENEVAVLELSSFQLQSFKLSPDVSVITNITENHLNWHKDMEEYVNDKANIFLHQNDNNLLILNYDDEICQKYAKMAPSKIKFFSLSKKNGVDIFANDGSIYMRSGENLRKIMDTKDILLLGDFNIKNYMAAICATWDIIFDSKAGEGKSEDEIVGEICENVLRVARTFKGVAHRLEFVCEIGGVKYYNSSIDTTPARTIATLRAFEKPVILIAGGANKNLSYACLGEAISKKAKKLILTGQTADLIEAAVRNYEQQHQLKNKIEIFRCPNLLDAVELVKKLGRPGDNVVLSPASSSFDAFSSYVDRGITFRKSCKLVAE
jgi:UDP-N-acetylmuramoylalanine--D-glutamate ligase